LGPRAWEFAKRRVAALNAAGKASILCCYECVSNFLVTYLSKVTNA